jgi:excisionase family DNA binding protein
VGKHKATQTATVSGERPLLTINETATLVGCRRETLWRWVRRGAFPVPRIVGGMANGRRRFVRSEVEAWMRSLPCAPAGPTTEASA